MSRIKIEYGIDLGTTNSAIARIENGDPTIKKTDTLKDTMPSCIGFNKKQSILAGDSAWNGLRSDRLRALKDLSSDQTNFFIEFKRTMGTDKKFDSSHMNRSFTSEELSAEVLKKLKSLITDEELQSVIITVPAKFTINQTDATIRAAKLAGFKHCELLQEPIAASMAYGLGSKSKDGFWMVFDFGGGTFDAALVKVEEGIMQVIDTEGDNYLGGKNLDYAIVNEIIIPYFKENFVIDSILADDSKKQIFQDAMKYFAEETKIQLSFNEKHNILSDLGDIPGTDDEGNEFELDITVTQADIEQVLAPIFQKAIDITKGLLERNNLNGKNLDALILVGGPTYSPVLRKMLEQQVCKPDTSVDPMTVVAKGAALFSATIDVSEEIQEATRDKSKIQLSIGYESTTVESEEFVTIKIEGEKTEGIIPESVYAEIVRGDKAWSSGKVEINETGEVIDVKLVEGKANSFLVSLFDGQGNILECEPNEFTIIQGTKVGSATLPYHIGIEIKSSSSGKIIFKPIKGLGKNQSTPATGIWNGLKTQKQLRPGLLEDYIKIPIYQGDYGAEGSRAIYNEHVYDVLITGEQLPALLPEGSEVDLTLKVDKSGRMSLSAFFPFLEYTEEIQIPEHVQEEIDDKWLESEIQKARQTLTMIEQEGIFEDKTLLNTVKEEINDIDNRFKQGRKDYDRKKDVLDSLKRCFKKIDDIQDASEWPKTEEELKDVFYRLEEVNNQTGNDKTGELVKQFKEQIPEVIKSRNVKAANQMIEDMRSLNFALVSQDVRFWVGFIHYFNENFETHDWSDRGRARLLVNQGLQICANNPSESKLRPVIAEIYNLLPDVEKDRINLDDKTVLRD
jgi:molecular chaperone DnaK